MEYEVTAKLWIKVSADTPDEAEKKAKSIVDEALYAYVRATDVQAGISKSKVTWVKENK